MKTIKIGFVGCGNISDIYLTNIRDLFREVEVIGVCDLKRERAERAVSKYDIPKLYDNMHELFDDEQVDIVLNITRPYEHYEVTKAAILAGKHVYTEKPLAPLFEQAKELVELAQKKDIVLGGAPDTFMGAGIQTCRKLIDDGYIGTPIGAYACMLSHGPEHWHPDPEFVYTFGGGPMLDIGPYYVSALINLLGGVERVTGMTKKSFKQRPILSKPKFGTMMDVKEPTYSTGSLLFTTGAIATLFTTFDVYSKTGYAFEVYGTEGTLMVPDPNTFGGPVRLLRQGEDTFETIPLLFGYKENCRALGLADMAKALMSGRDVRPCKEQLLHTVEVLKSFEKSQETQSHVNIESKFERKKPMAYTPMLGILDE